MNPEEWKDKSTEHFFLGVEKIKETSTNIAEHARENEELQRRVMNINECGERNNEQHV